VKKALVIYDTMWQSTEMMAKAIADGLLQQGVVVKMMNLRYTHRSDLITELLDAKAVLVGSSTLNNGMLPSVSDILMYMRGLKPRNKIGAAFGSYGWSGEAVKLITKALEEMKVDVVDPGIRIKYVPDHDALHPCVELGKKIGSQINESVSG
jgi:flavorubredoxin